MFINSCLECIIYKILNLKIQDKRSVVNKPCSQTTEFQTQPN